MIYPSYLNLYNNGLLQQRIDEAFNLLEACSICPRKCAVNRLKDQKGFCRTGIKPVVYSFLPHFGEEPSISGTRGSGTIFFSHCNMKCVYCQNYEFSQLQEGREVGVEELATFMTQLQDLGCHNINLVTPTHIMPQVLKALSLAIPKGLKIPLVYNTGGYELDTIIKLLDGIVDIYMPDMRYGDNDPALIYSQADDYPKFNQKAVKEMHRQVGVSQMDENGIIKKGLIIRHLVLPSGLSGTGKIMEFIANNLSKDTYISLMSQYFPCYLAKKEPKLNRRITPEEYEQAKQIMADFGLDNGWIQESFGLARFAGVNIKPI